MKPKLFLVFVRAQMSRLVFHILLGVGWQSHIRIAQVFRFLSLVNPVIELLRRELGAGEAIEQVEARCRHIVPARAADLRGAAQTGREVEELFDTRRDPGELDDRADADPETVARLRALADTYLETQPPWGEAPTREIGELELNQLRALGYAVP